MSQININNQSTIQRLIKDYILPHKLSIFFASIMMIISAGTTGLHAWLVRPALDEVLIKGNKEMLILIPIAINSYLIAHEVGRVETVAISYINN